MRDPVVRARDRAGVVSVMTAHKIIYTALFDGYDTLAPIPDRYRDDWDAICFTDTPEAVPDGWRAVFLDQSWFPGLPPVAISKIIKHQPANWLPPHDASIYIDANRTVIRPLDEFEQEFCTDTEFLSMTHPGAAYHDVYAEIRACKRHNRDYLKVKGMADKLDAQEQAYRAVGAPERIGHLCELGTIYRRDTWTSWYIGSLWCAEFLVRETWRDQIALRYVLWRYGLSIDLAPREEVMISGKKIARARSNRYYFKFDVHRPARKRALCK